MGEKLPLPVRTGMMLAGILLIGVSVALYRLAAFGVDPFTGMNLGISTFLGWSFGNWQLLANALILAVVFFTVRSCIGLGTAFRPADAGAFLLYPRDHHSAECGCRVLCGSLRTRQD